MRISDWSSDVCSSDLRNALEHIDNWADAAALARSEKEALQRQRIELAQISTHAAQLAAENEQLRRLLDVADAVTQPSVEVEGLYEPPNAFTHHLIFNKGLIGRASCRERVCLYVYISVVAGSIKKKEKKKKE